MDRRADYCINRRRRIHYWRFNPPFPHSDIPVWLNVFKWRRFPERFHFAFSRGGAELRIGLLLPRRDRGQSGWQDPDSAVDSAFQMRHSIRCQPRRVYDRMVRVAGTNLPSVLSVECWIREPIDSWMMAELKCEWQASAKMRLIRGDFTAPWAQASESRLWMKETLHKLIVLLTLIDYRDLLVMVHRFMVEEPFIDKDLRRFVPCWFNLLLICHFTADAD